MSCKRCNDTGSIGLETLPMRCPDCELGGGVVDDVERIARSPSGFARLCAHIGYSDTECVTAIVSQTDLSAEEARRVVDEEYKRFAEGEADNAAREWLRDEEG